MIDPTDAEKTADGFDDRELRLLEEIVRSPHVTQRSLSRKLTIGLGMTNLLIRRLVTKGYVRATHAGWRSWAYSLTPQGMTRRVRPRVTCCWSSQPDATRWFLMRLPLSALKPSLL